MLPHAGGLGVRRSEAWDPPLNVLLPNTLFLRKHLTQNTEPRSLTVTAGQTLVTPPCGKGGLTRPLATPPAPRTREGLAVSPSRAPWPACFRVTSPLRPP